MYAPAAALAAATLLAAGCGGGSSTTSSSSSPAASSTPAASTTPAAATTAATTTPAASTHGVSGTWDGSYSGAYSGTFVLNWTQAGSHLVGAIQLSAPSGTLPIHGTLSGSTISFGTVGSVAITYTGSVSGSSMSGSYQTPGGGGSWSASKK
jgi:hypothetical protein